ncbi:4-hydroxyphenylacetate 3-hydroxylase N-terminal domain-containing protein [Priestia aryabhattai]|uniref:4-hydroxyphenylacetate 3-hydroxylase family protein n=1 Tax=Priestia aryabhattai TaxID=412384 RepID=UPI0028827AAF|nr:4-hydroxyphenylacetate 3-hydroxylase N-terminal domain-containing protein [Priestia aryabhattai]MDT0145652.1 4-hydroxyphenylacetate 3-hydroxylase N-terminal domain-containing protein [Priestia aryabhattai]MDT0151192.1 4-hydroxyphenylacetate 3-hydroxylase N-terminal domain-containing protein [Priestia aryabhattai]MED4002525.1 4-hydroxyphenylacetate 3-hydroxylase N-terminal domain-containing protein [Priestia aryabhattai]
MSSEQNKFIKSLRDERNIWLNGKKIDITTDENFKGTLKTISELLSMLDHPEQRERVGYLSPKTKEFVHTAFYVPHSYEDVVKRRIAFETWSQSTDGVMSRLSDYARSRLTGWYASREDYKKFDKHFPGKIKTYYEKARDEHLFLSIIQRDPQINRASQASNDLKDLGLLRITKKTSDGVFLDGAKMIGTAAPYSNDLIVYPLSPLKEDQKCLAHMLVVAPNSPGMHMVCREPFASHKEQQANAPLSKKYDEMDALLIFDHVFVPWERVLLYDNPEALWKIKLDSTSNSLAYHQAVVRLLTKLEFVTAIALEIAEAIGADSYLHVQEKMGELIMQVETIRALLIASEREGKTNHHHTYIPNFTYIETARNLGSKYYPRALEILQLIGAGGFIQLPASIEDFQSPLSSLMNKYFAGANTGAEQRTKLFKLAWDLVGSPLGSRHELYERFYAGDPIRNTANQYHHYDKQKLKQMVKKYIS